MKRRQKGDKRYASQRERRMTDPLIREDEAILAKEAMERIVKLRSERGRDDTADKD